MILDRLVPSHVHILARKQGDHLVEHIAEELESRLLRAEQIRMHAPVRGHARRRSLGGAEPGIGDDGGGRVPWYIDLRDNGHAALARVCDDPAHHLLGIKSTVETRPARPRIDVGGRCGPCGNTPRPDAGQLRILLDLQAPPLVIGQMPLQHVELVQRHPVDEIHDELRRLVVPRGVEHQAAPGEARRVDNAHRRQRDHIVPGLRIRSAQLPKRDRRVEQAPRVARREHHASRRDIDLIPFRIRDGQEGVQPEYESIGRRCLSGPFGNTQSHPAGLQHQLREIARHSRCLAVARVRDRRIGAEREYTAAQLDVRRSRDDAGVEARSAP